MNYRIFSEFIILFCILSCASGQEFIVRYNTEYSIYDISVNKEATTCFTLGFYMKTTSYSLHILNIENLSNIQSVSSLSLNITDVSSMYFDNDNYIIYVSGSELIAISVVDIENPRILSQKVLNSEVTNIDKRDNILYMSTETNFMSCYDVSDPSNPIFISNLGMKGYCNSIALYEKYAYLSCGYNGLFVVDISNPVNLSVKFNKKFDKSSDLKYLYGNIIHNSTLYMYGKDIGIFDLFTPSNPEMVDSIYLHEVIRDVNVYNETLLVGLGRLIEGVLEIDISNEPFKVAKVGRRNILGTVVESIDVSQNKAFVGTSSKGLYVLDITKHKYFGLWSIKITIIIGSIAIIALLYYVSNVTEKDRIIGEKTPLLPDSEK